MSIFVFGSNEAGIHGAGAAKHAKLYCGAEVGKGFGPSGNSFAIPTKDWHIDKLPLYAIRLYVMRFIAYAERSPETFHLTKIGCGLAGYTEADISPMFEKAPPNVILVDDFGNPVRPASEWYMHIRPSS